MRKPRESKLDPHAEALTAWFNPVAQGGEGLTLDQAAARLSERYSITVSPSRLSQWWQAQQQRALQDKILSGIATGSALNRQIDAEFSKNPAPELDQLLRLFKTITLHLTVNGQADPDLLKLAASFTELLLKNRGLSLKESQLQLDRQRFEFDAAQKAKDFAAEIKLISSDAKLSEAEKIDAIRARLFGALPA